MKQQLSVLAVVLWQLRGPSMGHSDASGEPVSGLERGVWLPRRQLTPTALRMEARDGILLYCGGVAAVKFFTLCFGLPLLADA